MQFPCYLMTFKALQAWRYISKYIIQPADPQRVHVLVLHAVFDEWDIQHQVSNMSGKALQLAFAR